MLWKNYSRISLFKDIFREILKVFKKIFSWIQPFFIHPIPAVLRQRQDNTLGHIKRPTAFTLVLNKHIFGPWEEVGHTAA